MNLREAKKELIEHGYEIHKLNEGCYGVNVDYDYGGCGYGYSSSGSNYKTPRAPYKKDSELSDEELKARNELRAKKAKNKENGGGVQGRTAVQKSIQKLIYMFSKSENFALAGSLSKTSYKS